MSLGLRRGLRGMALALVLLALWDPALPSPNPPPLPVGVVAPNPWTGWPEAVHPEGEVAALAAALEAEGVRWLSGLDPEARAVLVLGPWLPVGLGDGSEEGRPPVFLLLNEEDQRTLANRMEVRVAAEAPPGAWIPVEVSLPEGGTGGDLLLSSFSVGSDGQLGDARLLDRIPDVGPGRHILRALAEGPGLLLLRIELREREKPTANEDRDRGLVLAHAERLVSVASTGWPLLFHDPRPSWGSTFLRRAAELDPRFQVEARITTAPGLGTEWGRPPRALAEPGALDGVRVVVVGAPHTLPAAEVAALERFLRIQGGSVILLPDTPALGGFAGRMGLPAPGTWRFQQRPEDDPVRLEEGPPEPGGGTPPRSLLARALYAPERLPPGASAEGGTQGEIAPLWSLPVGQGRLYLQGALDAWVYRDPERSDFAPLLLDLLAEAAARVPPPLELRVAPDRQVVLPGTPVPFELVPRGGATPETEAPRSMVAPLTPGEFSLQETLVSGESAVLPLLVREGAPPPMPPSQGALTAWARAHGGDLLNGEEAPAVARALRDRVGARPEADPWHPMRSPWWILPLTLLLGAEWWLRRRDGLR